jgi:group I intron endonuclease
MGLIYMRISPSGGRYIGQTILSEIERWKEHVKEAFNPNSNNYNTILNQAIRKYGKNNFQVIILEDNIIEENLDAREIYWIDEYKTYWKDNAHGYNMTRGGDGHRLLKIDNDELINLWNQGLGTLEIAEYFHCERQAIRDRLLGLGYTSKDLIDRRQQKSVNMRDNNHYDKEEIIDLWNQGLSMTKIGECLKHDRHSISRILSKNGITQEEIAARQIINMTNTTKKSIIQYNKQGQYIKEWPSLSEAARQLHLHVGNITKVLRGERHTTGGFIFKYKEIYDDK